MSVLTSFVAAITGVCLSSELASLSCDATLSNSLGVVDGFNSIGDAFRTCRVSAPCNAATMQLWDITGH